MKRMRKIMLSLLAVFALVMVIQVPTKAATGTVTMTGFTDKSVTVSWTVPTLPAGYTLNSYDIYDTTTKTYVATNISPSQTSLTVPITGKGYVAYWRVEYNYTTGYGSQYSSTIGWSYVNTTPVKYTTKQFSSYNFYSSSKKVDFVVSKAAGSTGTKLEIYQLSNGKKKKTLTSKGTYFDAFKFASNTAYKYRVRSYYTNDTTKKTYYGSWSSYRYFAAPTISGSYTTAAKGINVTLKKGSGIIKYKVQVSAKKNSGFKTVKTIKVGKKSKYTYKITKCSGKKLKKGKTYYIRVIPVLKGNKSSDAYGTATVSFYR